MIFMPFPRFVGPISRPPPLAITNVASMKHSSSSSAPFSRSSLATSSKPDAKSRGSTKFESVDAQFCSSDSFAAACAIALLFLESTEPLPAHDESESACVQHAHREYAPPENASECAPTVRPSAESFLIYSGSTAIGNFEIGSNHLPRNVESL